MSEDQPSGPSADYRDLSDKILLEDYKLWQRELEKQDRWIPQSLWTALAGCAAGLALVRNMPLGERTAAEIVLTLVAGLFVSMSADFFVGRVNTYFKAARFVAAARRTTGVLDRLKIDESLRVHGAALISDRPEAFVRTGVAGRKSAFRSLYRMHLIVLGLLYAMLAVILWHDLPACWPWWLASGTGLTHLFGFMVLFRWRSSEADSLGAFFVTTARDQGVAVARDAEARLGEWLRRPPTLALVTEAQKAVQVIVDWEDRRFRTHGGIDWVSVAAVALGRRARGGASTIAMQLARQLVPRPHDLPRRKRLPRKLFESLLGSWLIRTQGHDFVLATWLETIPYGHSKIRGLANAAETYFHRGPALLDAIDGLILAERITISTGRFDAERFKKFVAWAVKKGHLRDSDASEALRRYQEVSACGPSSPPKAP